MLSSVWAIKLQVARDPFTFGYNSTKEEGMQAGGGGADQEGLHQAVHPPNARECSNLGQPNPS